MADTPCDTNYPHVHMVGSGDIEKRKYLRLRAGILRTMGLLLWCNHCDEMLTRNLFEPTEEFFKDVIGNECPSAACTTTESTLLENQNAFDYVPPRKKRRKRSKRRPEPPKNQTKVAEKSKKSKFVTHEGQIINTLVTQRNPKTHYITPKSTKPFIIPPENLPDLPDVAENFKAPQQFVSKIKINVIAKPAATSTKVNSDHNDLEVETTTAAIPNSTAAFSPTDHKKSDPAVNSNVQSDSIYIIDSPEASPSKRTDHTDATTVGSHTSGRTFSRTVDATQSTVTATAENIYNDLTQSHKQHTSNTHSTKLPSSLRSLLDIDCTAMDWNNDTTSKGSSSSSVKNFQSVESDANETKMVAPMPAPRTGIPRAFNYQMIGEMLMKTPKAPENHESSTDRTPLTSEMPDLVMSVDQSRCAQMQRHESDWIHQNEPRLNATQLDSEDKIIPIGERDEIVHSVDPTVLSLVKTWPWPLQCKNMISNLGVQNRHTVHFRQATLKKEFKEMLDKSYLIRVQVTGYPKDWTRADLLDKLINWPPLSGLPFVPCFIEFTQQDCNFLTYNCSDALKLLFSRGLVVPGDDWRLNVAIHQLRNSRPDIKFRLQHFLGNRLLNCYSEKSNTLDLTEFLLQPDISMFCYFPLNNAYNQQHIIQMESPIQWKQLTILVLAGNRLTSINRFGLIESLPALQKLDLSNNLLESVSSLACCRGMFSIQSLRLEGNPLCLNFIHQDNYIGAVKLLFPRIVFLDSVRIGGLPSPVRNFCPETSALPLVDQFLEMFFSLLESKTRIRIADMYSADAMFTVSCQSKLKKNPDYEHLDLIRVSRDIRQLNKIEESCILGCDSIAQHLSSWLPVYHDSYSFTVDVLSHTETSTVVMVSGTLRVLSEPLRDDCPVFDFARTLVLRTSLGELYRITNDMWHLAEPAPLRANAALRHPRKPALSLQLESAPSEDLASDLVSILMNLTKDSRRRCSRCLELRNWNLRAAIQYFLKLVQDDKLSMLDDPVAIIPD